MRDIADKFPKITRSQMQSTLQFSKADTMPPVCPLGATFSPNGQLVTFGMPDR